MNKSIKIVNIESDDESVKEEASKMSEVDSNILVYEREVLIKIGSLPTSEDLPAKFEDKIEVLLEEFPDYHIIFPGVPKVENAEEVDDYDVINSDFGVLENLRLMEDACVEEQIEKFQELVEMTQQQVEAMKEVSDALEIVLMTEFPDCKTFPFGSSASGLGFKDCDLDIHVELGTNARDETFYVKAGMWGDRFRTRKVCEILRRVERFKSAVHVLNARTPIIRLKERRTDIKCDINVVSSMGVKNTEYLAFCKDQDPRFLPLVSILKYFCRKQEITGSGKGDHLNSYTLVLMVIFFLQSRNILHSVEALQKGVEEEEVDGWNFALCPDLSLLQKLEPNRSSVLKLLSQFFKFYLDFPYDSHVICPLVGQLIKKYNIRQGIYLPSVLETAPSFGRKKEKFEVNKVLVVQDPFELTRNVGHAVSRSRLDHVVEEFSTAMRLLVDLKTEKKEVKFWMLFEPGLSSYRDILATHFVPISAALLRLSAGLHMTGGQAGELVDCQLEVGDSLVEDNLPGGQLEDNLVKETPNSGQAEDSVVQDIADGSKMADIQDSHMIDRPPDAQLQDRKQSLVQDRPPCDYLGERQDNLGQDRLPGNQRAARLDIILQDRTSSGQSEDIQDHPRPPPTSSSKLSAHDQARQVLFHQQSLRFPPPRLQH